MVNSIEIADGFADNYENPYDDSEPNLITSKTRTFLKRLNFPSLSVEDVCKMVQAI